MRASRRGDGGGSVSRKRKITLVAKHRRLPSQLSTRNSVIEQRPLTGTTVPTEPIVEGTAPVAGARGRGRGQAADISGHPEVEMELRECLRDPRLAMELRYALTDQDASCDVTKLSDEDVLLAAI